MFSARYSSGSSGLPPAYSPSPARSFAWCSSNESEMYLRKIRPRTTCLYSAASILLRSLSAASHSFCSKPILAELWLGDFVDFGRGIYRAAILGQASRDEKGKSEAWNGDCQSHSLSSLGFGSLSE